MIDLHCHVLPGVDDGPATMDASVELVRAAGRAGIDTIIATPHVNPRFPTRAATVREGVRAVTARIAAEGLGVTLRTGGELDVAHAAELDDEELLDLRLGGGEWLLMECPMGNAAAGPFELILRALQARGHRIVLAHPERSPIFHRRPDLLERLVGGGMLSSLTAGSLVGRFGRDVRRLSMDMFEAGLVHNVTSDAHDAVHRRPGLRAELSAAAAELPGLEKHVEWMTVGVPQAILDGGNVPPRPASLPRRARRRWLLRRA